MGVVAPSRIDAWKMPTGLPAICPVVWARELQYFSQLMQRANSLEKTQMLEKLEDKRRRGLQRLKWLDGITD